MKLKELCDISNGSILMRFHSDNPNGEKVKIISVKAALGDDSDVRCESLDTDNPQLLRAQKGDVIMSITQPNIFVIDERLAGWVVPSTFAYFHIKDSQQLDANYLKWFFDYSDEYQRQLHLLQNAGNNIQFLKISGLKDVSITLPPMQQQKRIATMMVTIEKEKELYAKKIELQTKLMNYQGNQWIKENQNGK